MEPGRWRRGTGVEEERANSASTADIHAALVRALAGGTEVGTRSGLTPPPPPPPSPRLVIHEGERYGLGKDGVTLYDQSVAVLSLEQLRKRLESMTAEDFYPLMETHGCVGWTPPVVIG